MKASVTMLATYSYTQAELAIVATKPTIEAMAGYLGQNAISALCFAKYASEEAARLEAAKPLKLGVKMSEKGCVTITGINGQWGVSLYPQQWLAVFAYGDTVKAFIAANDAELSKRGTAEKARKAAEKLAGKVADVVNANPATTAPAPSTVGQSA